MAQGKLPHGLVFLMVQCLVWFSNHLFQIHQIWGPGYRLTGSHFRRLGPGICTETSFSSEPWAGHLNVYEPLLRIIVAQRYRLLPLTASSPLYSHSASPRRRAKKQVEIKSLVYFSLIYRPQAPALTPKHSTPQSISI